MCLPYELWGLKVMNEESPLGILEPGPKGNRDLGAILWMDEILHRFEAMGNHCLLVFTGESFIPGFLRWCRILSIHSNPQTVLCETGEAKAFFRILR